MSDSWPIYYKDALKISNPQSNVGVITLWTPTHIISEKLDQKSFHLAGQLYSKRGINFVFRNILASPTFRYIVVCGADRSGSADAIVNFFAKGVNEKSQVIDVENAEVHVEIDKNALENLRKNIKIIDLRNEVNPKNIAEKISALESNDNVTPWAKAQIFPEPEPVEADKYPSEKLTYVMRSEFIWQNYIKILRHIMRFGSDKEMLSGKGVVKEAVNIISVITAEDPYSPQLKDIFEFNKKELDQYYADFFHPDRGSEDYNYGERIFKYPVGLPRSNFNSNKNQKAHKALHPLVKQSEKYGLDQFEEIYEKLKRYSYDRGGVIAIWNPWTDNVGTDKQRNVPCMSFLQFTYRSKKLHLTAYFRSNDMYGGWPRNAFALRKLQFDLAKRLDKKPGFLTTISNCAQVYESDFEAAHKILKKFEKQTLCQTDPRGALIIEIDGKEIVVRHMSGDGNVQLSEYRQDGSAYKSANRMIDQLLAKEVISDISHATDIGGELAKAEYCVKHGLKFTQDRDWKELMDQ